MVCIPSVNGSQTVFVYPQFLLKIISVALLCKDFFAKTENKIASPNLSDLLFRRYLLEFINKIKRNFISIFLFYLKLTILLPNFYKMKFEGLIILPIIVLIACSVGSKKEINQAVFYKSSDFTLQGEFTSGIEGPATDKDGNIYLVNFATEGTIGKVKPEGKSNLFITLPEGSTGNGIRINRAGNLFVADYTGHNILEVDVFLKTINVYVHINEMNQPNDLAIMKNGKLFASDPNWSASTGNLWRIDTDKSVVKLEEDMGTTNGIEVSPDEQTLYVNESVQRKVWAYNLSTEGDISNKHLFYEFPDFGMDGMRCDIKGNLYITRYGKGTVAIISPKGKLLHEVMLTGKKPSNITFGGKDGKTCYITLQDRGCLESFRTEFEGREWSWKQ